MKPAFLRKIPMSLIYRLVLFLTWLVFKVFYRLKVYAAHSTFKGGGIIASNHVSFLDPPLIAVSFPEPIHFLARKSLFRRKYFGGFIRKLNAHPVSGHASDIGVFKTIGEVIAQKGKVLLFPEGSRSVTNTIDAFKPGIAILALKFQAKIIPTYVQGTYEIWGRNRKYPKLFGKTYCVFGTPLDLHPYQQQGKRQAQEKIQEELKARILALKDWLEKGAKGSPP